MPALLAGGDRAPHVYKKVSCRALSGTECERSLPSLYHINGNWSINHNWMISAELEPPAVSKAKVSSVLSDLFFDSENRCEILAELPVYGKRKEPKQRKDSGAPASVPKRRRIGRAALGKDSDNKTANVKAALNRRKRMTT